MYLFLFNFCRCLRCPLDKEPEDDLDSLIYDDADYDEPSSSATASIASSASAALGSQSP